MVVLETTRDRSACTCEDMLCTNDEWQWSIARINLKSLHSATNGEQVKKKSLFNDISWWINATALVKYLGAELPDDG